MALTAIQRLKLQGYLEDDSIEIDAISFLTGGNASRGNLTVCYFASTPEGRVLDTDVIGPDGETVLTKSARVHGQPNWQSLVGKKHLPTIHVKFEWDGHDCLGEVVAVQDIGRVRARRRESQIVLTVKSFNGEKTYYLLAEDATALIREYEEVEG